MIVDPKADAVIIKAGKCKECGTNLPKTNKLLHDVHYCRACVKKLQPENTNADQDEARKELANRELCKRRLIPFAKRLKPSYEVGWFHADLAARLERFAKRVENGESPRMILNVPPRHGKSELASKLFVAWYLGRNPSHGVIAATHSDRLALDNSRDVLNYVKEDSYIPVFPDTVLDKDNKGAMGWRTTEGGSYKPVGVGAGISGYGAHVLIIDDPHRDKDAFSETVRDSVWRWFNSSAKTRLAPGGGIIVIQTRWSLDDLSGRLINEEGSIDDGGIWEWVCYPAQATSDEYRLKTGQIVDHNEEGSQLLRKKGEMLHPERWPPDLVNQHKRDPITWAALYQQNPVAGEAAIFTDDMIHTCKMDDIPERLLYYSTWDLAIGQRQHNDYTVHLLAGVDLDDNIWIVDVFKARLDAYEIVETLLDSYQHYKQEIIGIEKTHLSMAVSTFLEKRQVERHIYGINVVELMHGNKDKVARSRAIQARMRQGKVLIPYDAPWFDDFEKELREFPAGRHDDMVDALSYMGQLIEEMDIPRQKRPHHQASWRDKIGVNKKSRSWRSA